MGDSTPDFGCKLRVSVAAELRDGAAPLSGPYAEHSSFLVISADGLSLPMPRDQV